MKELYSTSIQLEGGRGGTVKSDDGNLSLTLSIPKEFGGPGGSGTNPEQLFAAGYAACFESSVRLAAQQQKVTLEKAGIHATTHVLMDEVTGYHLALKIEVLLPGLTTTQAEQLIEAAQSICPYAKAVKDNIDVQYSVKI